MGRAHPQEFVRRYCAMFHIFLSWGRFPVSARSSTPRYLDLFRIGPPKTRGLPGHAWHQHVLVECPGQQCGSPSRPPYLAQFCAILRQLCAHSLQLTPHGLRGGTVRGATTLVDGYHPAIGSRRPTRRPIVDTQLWCPPHREACNDNASMLATPRQIYTYKSPVTGPNVRSRLVGYVAQLQS